MLSIKSGSRRRIDAGLAAVIGALLGLILTPFMVSLWVYDDDEPWADAPRLERTIGPTLESWGLLDFGGEDLPYEVYGKAFFLVYALMIPAMKLAHAAAADSRGRGNFEVWSWRVMYGALLAGGLGDFVAYWGVSLPGIAGEVVSVVGFYVEFLAMPVIVLSSTVFGVAALRVHALPRWACALLIVAPVSAIATTLLVTDYIPNAIVVPVSLTWGAIGVWLALAGGGVDAPDPAIASGLAGATPS